MANMPPDARVVSGNVEAVLAYYDPLRGKQQGLGTKLPHAKTRRLPGCACACPHNITLIGGARTIVTSPPEYGWFQRDMSIMMKEVPQCRLRLKVGVVQPR